MIEFRTDDERYIKNLENRVELLESKVDCIGDYKGEVECLFGNCPFVDKCMKLQKKIQKSRGENEK
jgi:hypothetical protein